MFIRVFCRMACEEAAIIKMGPLGGEPKAKLKQNYKFSKPDVQVSVLDNTYAVGIISTKSMYTKGI